MFRYTKRQIILHWTVVVLLIFQYLFNEPMGEAFDNWMRQGQKVTTTGSWLHIIAGILVLVLAAWRMMLHFGSPQPPRADSMLEKIASVVHWLLYALLFLIPFSGAMAWFAGVGAAGDVHGVLTNVLLFVAGLHVVGALYHQFIVKDNLLARMDPRG